MNKSEETKRPSIPNNYEHLVRILVEARRDRGLSQENLSDKIGCTPTLVGKWEAYQRMPSGFMLMCWLEALEYDIEAVKR